MKRFLFNIILLLVATISFGQNLLLKQGGGIVIFQNSIVSVIEYNERAILLFDEMIIKPSKERKLIISNTFDLIPDTIFNKLDLLYMAGHVNDNGESFLNWIDPAGSNSLYITTGSVGFKVDTGFSGGGVGLLGTNYILDGNGNYKQNSASMAVFINNNVDENSDDVGYNGSVDSYIRSLYSGQMSTRINDATTVGKAGLATSRGINSAIRIDSDSRSLYKNNTTLFSNTGYPSTGLPGDELFFLGSNVLKSTRIISGCYLGAGLETSEVKILNDAINYYFTSIGTALYEPDYDLVVFGDKESQYSLSRSNACDEAIVSTHAIDLLALGDYASITDSIENELRYYSGYSATDNIFGAWGNHDDNYDASGSGFMNFYNVDKTYYIKSIGNIDFFIFNTLLSADETEFISMGDAQGLDTATVQNSTQGQWLINSLSNSTAKWKVLVYHIPTWVSNFNLNLSPQMDWDWAAHDVDVIINSHVHFYERLLVPTGSGSVPVLNVGTSGAAQLTIGTPSPYSQVRMSDATDSDFGSGMYLGVENDTDTLRFILNAVDLTGSVFAGKDTLKIVK